MSSIRKCPLDSENLDSLSMNYYPVVLEPRLKTMPLYSSSPHLIGGLLSQMRLSAWEYELSYENDVYLRAYLHFGIKEGFYIVNPEDEIPSYFCDNYSSSLCGEANDYVKSIIREELSEGKYLVVSDKPHCIHALGAIPKNGGGYRIITDCKRPIGSSINNFLHFFL